MKNDLLISHPNLITTLSLCAILSLTPQVFADEKSDMEKLQKDIAELQKELKKVQDTRDAVQQDLQKNEAQMNSLQKKVDKIQQDIAQQKP
jgi:septal ring factor EnvC (AmiA/AmiB activator)